MAGAANAATVVTSTNFNVWHGNSSNPGDISDPSQQALPSNPVTSQTFVGSFNYSGPIDFANMSQATDLMSNFIPGVGLPADQMSTPTFDAVTLFSFNFTFATNLVGASITHDDGISLFDITTSSGNLISGNEGPTVAATTILPTLEAGHIYQLWYIAANGAPSILRFDDGTPAVPEPATWAMLVLGFGVIGVTARRRRAGSGRVAENLG